MPNYIRAHERMDYKRCPKKWYWRWRKGLVPRARSFGALELGTFAHEAWRIWYGTGYKRSEYPLQDLFEDFSSAAIEEARVAGASDIVLEKAEELELLGKLIMRAYQEFYQDDPQINVVVAEIPLEFSLGNGIIHLLKPDMLFRYRNGPRNEFWLMENKTTASLNGRSKHLTIDDQARPYGAMAELALKNAGVLGPQDHIAGILYNYLRKGIPDQRKTDAAGKALNKDGSISARQPAPMFLRKQIVMTDRAKAIALRRIQAEARIIADTTQGLRTNYITPDQLMKTPHHSCPRFCQYFAMCEAEEQGSDIRRMEKTMYRRENPYDYAESTDEHTSFELG